MANLPPSDSVEVLTERLYRVILRDFEDRAETMGIPVEDCAGLARTAAATSAREVHSRIAYLSEDGAIWQRLANEHAEMSEKRLQRIGRLLRATPPHTQGQ